MSLPSGWKITGLDECYWFQEGPGVRKWQFTDSGIKLLNVANIEKTGRLNLTKTERHIAVDEVEKRYKHFLMDAGDLVIASSGISFDEDGLLRTRGAFVEPQHLPLCLNTSTIRFKAKAEISSLDYLKHWLDSREFRQQITKLVTGSAQQNFGPSHLKALRISLPPLPEQRRIAAILDQADALRAKRREALAQLDQLTQSIFIEMFGDPLLNPMGLPMQSLRKLGKVKTGGTPPSSKEGMFNGDIPFVTPGDLSSNLPAKRTVTEEGAAEAEIVRTGAALVCCIGATIGKMDKAKSPSAFNQQINAVEWNEEVDDVYGITVLSFFKSRIASWGASTTLPILKKSSFEKIEIPVPTVALQKKFAQRVLAVEKFRTRCVSFQEESESLFSSLQHRAFRGEL